MTGQGELQELGVRHPVDIHDLDERIRSGEAQPEALLRYAPWTGDAFVRLDAVPQLKEAFDAPAARLRAWFREPAFPWFALVMTLSVAIAGLMQLFLPFAPVAGWSTGLLDLYRVNASGFEPLVLDHAWWSAWGSQYVHGGAFHLFPNLAVLGYCSYRVERLMGWRTTLAVAAGSVAVGILLVTLFQRLPVIGSSILGFGFWGAQLALGFRFGDHIPPRQRAFYGYGNLAFFAFLFGGTLQGEGTSHWAHVGGFIGGVFAAGLCTPGHVVPAARAQVARLRIAAAALITAVVPVLYGPVLRTLPMVAWHSPQTMLLEEVGASIEVPWRLTPEMPGVAFEKTVRGMPAWTTSPSSPEFVFCGVEKLRWELAKQGDPVSGDLLAGQWARSIDGEAVLVEPPPARGAGWTAHALDFIDEDGVPRYRLVEHHLQRGRVLNRIGYVVSLDNPSRQVIFERMLESVQVGEPPDLAAARDAHLRNGASERARLDLANALYDIGDLEQADALFMLVATGKGRLEAEAVLDRLAMWASHPESFTLSGDAWFTEYLLDFPRDRQLQEHGIRVLSENGRCEDARFFHESFGAARPEAAELVHTADAVMRCEAKR